MFRPRFAGQSYRLHLYHLEYLGNDEAAVQRGPSLFGGGVRQKVMGYIPIKDKK